MNIQRKTNFKILLNTYYVMKYKGWIKKDKTFNTISENFRSTNIAIYIFKLIHFMMQKGSKLARILNKEHRKYSEKCLKIDYIKFSVSSLCKNGNILN